MRAELPLELFALNCCVPETLSKIVLGSVSSAVPTVTDDRDDEFAILLVVGKNAFEAIREVKEFLSLSHSALQDPWLDLSGGEGTAVLINAKATATSSLVEEASLRRLGCHDIQWVLFASCHAALNSSRRLGCSSNCHFCQSLSTWK